MNKKIQTQNVVITPATDRSSVSTALTMHLAKAVWAKVFILFLLLGFWRTGGAQSLFQPGNPPMMGDAPVGINLLTPFPTADLHVNGQVRFENLNMSTGMSQYLTTDPLGNLFWQDGIVPQPGFAFGQTLYWDNFVNNYMPTNLLHIDPFVSGVGSIGIGTMTPSGKLNIHEQNAAANTSLLRFSTNLGGNAWLGHQLSGSNDFYINQIANAKMHFLTNGWEQMTINSFGRNGVVGIGTTNPTERLHLHEEQDDSANYIRFSRRLFPTAGSRIGLRGGGTAPHTLEIRQEMANAGIEFWAGGNPIAYIHAGGGGFLGVQIAAPLGLSRTTSISGGPAPLPPASNVRFAVNGHSEFGGDVTSSGNFYITSDERLKTNFGSLNTDWRKILGLNSYSYDFKQVEGLNLSTERSFGFKAQDVKEILPSLVSEGDSFLSVNYIGFIPFLTQGIQEHEERLNAIEQQKEEPNAEMEELKVENGKFIQRFEALEAENQDLKNRNEQLENRLADLEQKFNSICNLPCIQNNPAPSPNGNGFGQTSTLGEPPALEQNEPNPFAQETVIRYFLPEGAVNAKIEVRNIENKVVGSFPVSQAGHGNITLSAGTLAAGNYFYSLIINNKIVDTKKMILLN